LTGFSVRKTDKLAVRVAQAIWDLIPDAGLTPEASDAFVQRLAEITRHSYMRCSVMLSWLGEIRKDKGDALRIAYAVAGYLPCFDNNDTRAEAKYIGDPVFPVPGRFIAAKLYQDNPEAAPVVFLAFLAMGTILAGRVCIMKFSLMQADRLLRKIYIGRSKLESQPHPTELSGCYATIPSDWLALKIGRISDVTCTAEMRTINKALCHKRAVRKCSVCSACYKCDKGRDSCAIAVRRKTKERKEDERGSKSNSDPEGPDKGES
jgi:hypothetical protein